MFTPTAACSGFSVTDLAQAKAFYTEILGVHVEESGVGLEVHLPEDLTVFAYPKADHRPATYTMFNVVVENIDEAGGELIGRGVQFEHYETPPTDEKGILRGRTHKMGPDIAWLKDPAGNTLAVLQEA